MYDNAIKMLLLSYYKYAETYYAACMHLFSYSLSISFPTNKTNDNLVLKQIMRGIFTFSTT